MELEREVKRQKLHQDDEEHKLKLKREREEHEMVRRWHSLVRSAPRGWIRQGAAGAVSTQVTAGKKIT